MCSIFSSEKSIVFCLHFISGSCEDYKFKNTSCITSFYIIKGQSKEDSRRVKVDCTKGVESGTELSSNVVKNVLNANIVEVF